MDIVTPGASAAPDPPSESASARAKRPAHPVRRIAVASGVLFALLLAFLWFIGVFGGNVRTVVAGRLYRSSTLTGFNYTGVTAAWAGNSLPSVLKRDRIGTVVTLRGGSPTDDWYREEIADCAAAGVAHRDVPFSARSLPPPRTLAQMLDVFDHARYPVLIHCQAGSDRTGLVSALYANLYGGQPLDRAEDEELTWRYGHFPVGKVRAMDDFFTLYRRTSSGMGLRDWIVKKYPQLYSEQHPELRDVAGAN